jgi:D-alanyl-lipoteichoic acid acyltransferase DltB (MBOAT superfamily)
MVFSLHDILSYSPDNPLLFTKLFFWGFLLVVLTGYSLVYKKFFLRNLYLFLVSIFFYYKTGGFFFVLLLISTVVDYLAGRGVYAARKKGLKKLWVSASLIINLGMLAYFKYTFFFVDLFNRITGMHLVPRDYLAEMSNALFRSHFDITAIFLPVGISFYTFQTISYTLDIYRGKTVPVRRFTDFAFFVSFFPQLVAGPIVRAAQFIPQLTAKYSLTKREFGYALFLILGGLVKKMAIADYIAVNFVDRVFSHPAAFTGLENLLAVYGYALQIYCDFSGYTDIAIGVALLFGFRIPINFNSPYKAVILTDFWRRWHISLSSWLKDYLYIPLGGNRKGKPRMYLNLMVTMVLGGLWHGANYRFLIWGFLHGVGLAFDKLLGLPHWLKNNPPRWQKLGMTILTFHFVLFLWIFFRSHSMESASAMLWQITHHLQLSSFVPLVAARGAVVPVILLGFLVHWMPAQWQENIRGLFIRQPMIVKLLITILVAFFLIQIKGNGFQPFIYFQF